MNIKRTKKQHDLRGRVGDVEMNSPVFFPFFFKNPKDASKPNHDVPREIEKKFSFTLSNFETIHLKKDPPSRGIFATLKILPLAN